MAKIITATGYGYRKVIRVCSIRLSQNPYTPTAHLIRETRPIGTSPGLRPWEWCHDCRYNWQVQEFLWTGAEPLYYKEDGTRRPKTNTELLKEIKARLGPAFSPTEVSSLVGKEV